MQKKTVTPIFYWTKSQSKVWYCRAIVILHHHNNVLFISVEAAVVDPVEPDHVLKALEAYPDYKLSM